MKVEGFVYVIYQVVAQTAFFEVIFLQEWRLIWPTKNPFGLPRLPRRTIFWAKLWGHAIVVNTATYDLQWQFMNYTMAAYDLQVANVSCHVSYIFGGVYSFWGNPTFGRWGLSEHKRWEFKNRKGTKVLTKMKATWISERMIMTKQSKHECSKGSLWESNLGSQES